MTYKTKEQHTYGKASLMAAITFYIIATIAGSVYLWISNMDLLPGLKDIKGEFTFEAFTLFGTDNVIASLSLLVIALFLIASTFQIFWTNRIERITKRHTVPLLITFQIIIGVGLGLGMLVFKTPYLFAVPIATGTQSLVRGIVGGMTIDQREYKPYFIFEAIFVILASAGLITMLVFDVWITLPWLLTLLSSFVFNLFFNVYKYYQITKEPEWQTLELHTKKYKLLVEIWLSFRLSSDWLSTIWYRTIFNKRHR